MSRLITRRATLLTAGGLSLEACSRVTGADKLNGVAGFHHVIEQAERWTLASQRFLLGGGQLAREYSPRDISRDFKPNGTLHPGGDDYAAQLAAGFADWRLAVDGLVARPLSLSLAELRRLPARSQITRHDCVEGWSAVGGWTGVPVGLLLAAAQPLPAARYVVFHCADNLQGEPAKGGGQSPGQYYESLDLVDARHPQTILAYAMNGAPLPVPHGAPLRLRVERQLGYKQAKYVRRMELRSSLSGLYGGRGGYWEDRGYEWYAGI